MADPLLPAAMEADHRVHRAATAALTQAVARGAESNEEVAAAVLAAVRPLIEAQCDLDVDTQMAQARREGAVEALRAIADSHFYDGDADRAMPGYEILWCRADEIEAGNG